VNGPVFVLGYRCERSCICAKGSDMNGCVFVPGVSMSTVVYLCQGYRCERSCICARGIDVNGRVFVLGVSM
jgi:hypothetical protein